MTLDQVAERFQNVRRVGAKLSARCPAHDDAHNSLSIFDGEKRVIVKCHAECSTSDVLKKVGLTFADLSPSNGNCHGTFNIATVYEYRNEAGNLLYEQVRLEPKDFRFRRPGGEWNLNGVRRVLYRLQELVKADRTELAWLCEGEKDVDRLRSQGFIATTNPGGAGKWRTEFNEYLQGRPVIILPDKDTPGRKHAQKVAASLHGIAATIKVLELPDLPEHGDVSDWLNNGGTAEKLRELAEQAQEWQPQEKPQKATTTTAVEGAFHRTDSGNAELFAHRYGERVRYDHQRKQFLVWTEHSWSRDRDAEVRRMAKEAARGRYLAAADIEDPKEKEAEAKWAVSSESRQKLDATLSLAQAERPIADSGENWDADRFLLGCINGVVDLKTGTLRPGRPDDRITMSTGIAFDPDATCPRWEKFLEEVFDSNLDLIDWIHRAMGYSISGSVTEQAVFIAHGQGSNGKTVFHSAIGAAIGDYFQNTPFSTFELFNRPSIPNDLAALVGRRFVTASETNAGSRLNEARIKALSGGDPITARFNYGEFFTFQPTMKIWLSVNHTPVVQDDSFGFWRRVRLIPFLRQFSGEADDKDLVRQLREEAEGILTWIVRGTFSWLEHGLDPPECVKTATADYRRESDELGDFLEATCLSRPGSSVMAGHLFKAYEAWTDRENFPAKERLKMTTFGKRLSQRFHKKNTSNGRMYLGIELAAEAQGDLGDLDV